MFIFGNNPQDSVRNWDNLDGGGNRARPKHYGNSRVERGMTGALTTLSASVAWTEATRLGTGAVSLMVAL